MENQSVETKEPPKKTKEKKTPRKSKKKPEVLKKLIIETGIFVLSFD
jgi:hypothetical protein